MQKQMILTSRIAASAFILFILLGLGSIASAQTTYTSTGSGNWSVAATWSPTGVPGSTAGDIAIIQTGHTVTLNTSPPQTLAQVTVNGTLLFQPPARTLRARNVVVNSGGTIDLITPAFFVSHQMIIEPLASDPANITTQFQNNGTVDFNKTLTNCVLSFIRDTKGLQWLRGTGASLFDLGPVVMQNLSTTPPPTLFSAPAETDATQLIGESGGSSITMQNLVIDNRVGQVRGTTTGIPRYREDNPTAVVVPLTISGGLFLETGTMILNRLSGTSLNHTIQEISIGSVNSIAVAYTDASSETGARHNTGIALVSAANATTNLTVPGNVTAPTLTHTDEGVVIALVASGSGTGSDNSSTSGAVMTVNGNFDLSGARLGLVGNGTANITIAGDIGPGQGGFANGTMRFNFGGNFLLKNGVDSRYNGRRGGGGTVPEIRFVGTTPQTFDAERSIWDGTQSNAVTNWEIASGAEVTMLSGACIAIHNGFGLTVNGTLVCQNGAELFATLTGPGSGNTNLTMGANGIIRVADEHGLGNGNATLSVTQPLFVRNSSSSGWDLTSINTNGTIDYNGTSTQTITARNQQAGVAPNIQYHRLTISGGDKELESTSGSIVVNDNLVLQGGIVSGTANDTVRVLNAATTAISRTSGYINARLERGVSGVASTYFFPIGDNDAYRPISLILTASPATRLLATLISDNANDLASVNSPLLKVSDLRYYTFRNTGSNPTTIGQVFQMAINADDAVNQVPANSTLKIATRTTGNWQSQGPPAVNTSSLPTTFNSNTFSEAIAASSTLFVSLGTENPLDDPLPVELVEFSGRATGSGVELRWKTASELNNAGFIVLRNGEEIAHFRDSEALRGAGTSALGRQYQFRDTNVREGERYVYRLRSVDFDATIHDYEMQVEVVTQRISREFRLEQNYPNPFNPSTTIRYALPIASEVNLRVYDMLGRVVGEVLRSVKQEAGAYEVRFDAQGLASGVYIYRLEATSAQGRFVESKKMVLMK